VNPFDYKVRSGAMEAMSKTPLPKILGLEVAGTVDAVAPDVTGFAVGDDVFGWSDSGAYAEYALMSRAAIKPAELEWETAVALPVAGQTSERVLDQLKLTSGETLLSTALPARSHRPVQLAVAGCEGDRHGQRSQPRVPRLLGAIPTEYGAGLVERVRALAPDGVDAVFDVAGKGRLAGLDRATGCTDRIVTIADPSASASASSSPACGTVDCPALPIVRQRRTRRRHLGRVSAGGCRRGASGHRGWARQGKLVLTVS